MDFKPAIANQLPIKDNPAAPIIGRWQNIARPIWLVIAVLVLALLIILIPFYHEYILKECIDHFCEYGVTPPPGVEALRQAGITPAFYAIYYTFWNVVEPLTYFLMALLIFLKKPNERMALFGSFMLLAWGVTMSPLAIFGEINPAWKSIAEFISLPGLLALTLFFFLFPDGRFSSRPAGWLAGGLMLVFLVGHLLPDTILDYRHWPLPLAFLFISTWVGTMIGMPIHRYRQISNPVQKQQIKWVVFGVSAAVCGIFGFLFLPAILSPSLHLRPSLSNNLIINTGVNLSMLFIPLSFGFAILRYRLWDIDLLINRTLVYGTLTAGVVGLYALIVGGLGALFQSSGNLLISLLTTGLIAMLFAPLRERLQRWVNRLMYGERDDPYTVLSRLGGQLETSLALETVLPNLVETIRQAFRLPYVAIELRINGHESAEEEAFEIAASSGSMSPNYDLKGLEKLPLTYQGEFLGRLVLVSRTPGEIFSPADWRLLTDLARQAGAALHAVRLTAALQRSRERLVLAQEEERRRMRNDLHDGIGPQLAALILKIDTAQNRLTHDPLAGELLSDLAVRTRQIVSDVREVVYNLRPPILDGMGLVAAIQEMAARNTEISPSRLQIQVKVPDSLPTLPAAVEVALYRIGQEALANVVQHSGARNCNVWLRVDEAESQIYLEIRDDGKGLASERHKNVGLYSMVERAVEIGGTCTIESEPAGGAAVRVRLPIRRRENDETDSRSDC
jgi:signal transduction histidine kinase